jgi:hypothetical protein
VSVVYKYDPVLPDKVATPVPSQLSVTAICISAQFKVKDSAHDDL